MYEKQRNYHRGGIMKLIVKTTREGTTEDYWGWHLANLPKRYITDEGKQCLEKYLELEGNAEISVTL